MSPWVAFQSHLFPISASTCLAPRASATDPRRRSGHTLEQILVPDKYRTSTPPNHDKQLTYPPQINPLYIARQVQFSANSAAITKNTFWRFLLLSDGHIVQHLSILTRHDLTLDLQSVVNHPSTYPHPALDRVPASELPPQFESGIVERNITLLGPQNIPLLHASSAWSSDAYQRIMGPAEHRPLWERFVDLKLHVSREVLAVYFGTCDELAPVFGVPKGTYMWARDYLFRIDQRPFLIVHEIMSPQLQKYLGDIVPPQAVLEYWTNQ